MSGEDYALIALAETTQPCDNNVRVSSTKRRSKKKTKDDRQDEEKVSFTRRLSFASVRSNLSKLRVSLGKVNCFKGHEDEEEVPMMDVQRHKSIDIGVGIARRASLFLFTRRSVCVHPYHPYTPKQTVRKFYTLPDDKHEK